MVCANPEAPREPVARPCNASLDSPNEKLNNTHTVHTVYICVYASVHTHTIMFLHLTLDSSVIIL